MLCKTAAITSFLSHLVAFSSVQFLWAWVGKGGRGVAVVWLYDRTTRRGVPEKKRKVKGENITLLSTLEFCNQWIELSGSELYTMSLYVFSGVCR